MYYSLISRFSSGMNIKNYFLVQVSFHIDYSSSVTSDVTLQIDKLTRKDINLVQGYNVENINSGLLLLNEAYFKNIETEQNLINYLNSYDIPKQCFIFKDDKSINRALKLVNKILRYNTDFWNLVIFMIISVFFFFMKFNMTKNCLSAVKEDDSELKLKNMKFFYYYVILNLSTLFILPLFYRSYTDIETNECMGFNFNYFNSYFYDRSLISSIPIANLELFVKPFKNFNDEKQSIFFLHKPNFFSIENSSYTYVYNILFICIMVWISAIFSNYIFNKKSKIIDLNEDKKCYKYILTSSLFIIWMIFIIYGFIMYLDIIYLYHRFVFFSFKKIFHPGISFNFLITYWNIYFYIFIIWRSICPRYSKSSSTEQSRMSNSLEPREDSIKNNMLNSSLLGINPVDQTCDKI